MRSAKAFGSLQAHPAPKNLSAPDLDTRNLCWIVRALASALLLASWFSLTAAVQAQTPPSDEIKQLKEDIRAIKANQAELQKELLELKKLILARLAPNAATPNRELTINTAGAAIRGEPNAKVTLIEFSDYQCPFCSRYFQQTLPQLERDYIKTGKIKYVFIDFPIEALHPNALTASSAARCAGEQGKYWEMHDRFFSNREALEAANMTSNAKAIQIDVPKFTDCLDSKKYELEIRERVAEMMKIGINATPTFFLGLTSPNNPKVKIVNALNGAKPYEQFKALIENLLSSPASQ